MYPLGAGRTASGSIRQGIQATSGSTIVAAREQLSGEDFIGVGRSRRDARALAWGGAVGAGARADVDGGSTTRGCDRDGVDGRVGPKRMVSRARRVSAGPGEVADGGSQCASRSR